MVIGESGNRVIDWEIGRPARWAIGRPWRRRALRECGFTMIELMVVMFLISVLAAMGMAQYRNSVIYSRESVLKEDLFRLRDAIDQYYADKGQYPSTLDALVSDGYVRKLPEDPFTRSSTSWQTIPAEPDPNNPTAEAGVYDVKSGSDATAIDGSKYAEWD
ncbi:MAG TPA: prepilin-type N-terminal cleavage/methylation domain-containing protein [Vicinamibacterales bacterium]|nr:prepilin-type N-terminal cleavage/methylation domain-containing protein [Vicinamibacterales bacterium]